MINSDLQINRTVRTWSFLHYITHLLLNKNKCANAENLQASVSKQEQRNKLFFEFFMRTFSRSIFVFFRACEEKTLSFWKRELYFYVWITFNFCCAFDFHAFYSLSVEKRKLCKWLFWKWNKSFAFFVHKGTFTYPEGKKCQIPDI